MELETAASAAFREGRLSDCDDLLRRKARKSEADEILAAEVAALLGRTQEAELAARRMRQKPNVAAGLLARCTSIEADCLWHRGELVAALGLYELAVEQARASRAASLLCRANTVLFERVRDRTGFDSSLPFARVGDNLKRISRFASSSIAHLAFGRLEAKAGRTEVAKRHFNLARGLLLAIRTPTSQQQSTSTNL